MNNVWGIKFRFNTRVRFYKVIKQNWILCSHVYLIKISIIVHPGIYFLVRLYEIAQFN